MYLYSALCYIKSASSFLEICTIDKLLHQTNAINNNNNNNNHDNVYGAVIMAEPLREFTRFI